MSRIIKGKEKNTSTREAPSHKWESNKNWEHPHCEKCGVSKNSKAAMKKCAGLVRT